MPRSRLFGAALFFVLVAAIGTLPALCAADPPDTMPPQTFIASGPDATAPYTVSWAFSSSEDGWKFECRIDDGAWALCGDKFSRAKHSVTGPNGSSHVLFVRAYDLAGNADPTPASSTYTISTEPPDTRITWGPNEGEALRWTDVEIGWTASRWGRSYECHFDDALPYWQECGRESDLGRVKIPDLAEGPYDFAVRVIDTGGVADPTPATLSFIVDHTKPDTTFVSGPREGSSNREPEEIEFGSTEAESSFECNLDGATPYWTRCDAPLLLAGLPDGQHTFAVRALDRAGNADASPVTRSFWIDRVDPGTSVSMKRSGRRSRTFSFRSSDPSATFECRSNGGGTWRSCASPLTLRRLPFGMHAFSVRAVDAAGNVDGSPAKRRYAVRRHFSE